MIAASKATRSDCVAHQWVMTQTATFTPSA
jgi:hypothetical protein